MFQFRGLTLLAEFPTFSREGCPIRKSADIMLVCSSPQLIAAYHVLHRLSEPRHPPYALKCFKRVITITRILQLIYYPNMSKNFTNVQIRKLSNVQMAELMVRLRTYRPLSHIKKSRTDQNKPNFQIFTFDNLLIEFGGG